MFEIKNLSTGYQGRELIQNLSFSLPPASFLAIIGNNGAGKSTFFKALTRQLPYSGEIILNAKIQSTKQTNVIAALNQQNHLKFSIKVKDLVVMGKFAEKKFFEEYNKFDSLKVNDILKKLNIAHLAGRDFTKLSGGEQQLVWLAQMMAQESEYYLLDEPTQGLDIYNKKKIFLLMENWVEHEKKTVICITHDLQNLNNLKGFILNISKTNPILEILNEETLKENREFLELGPYLKK